MRTYLLNLFAARLLLATTVCTCDYYSAISGSELAMELIIASDKRYRRYTTVLTTVHPTGPPGGGQRSLAEYLRTN